MNAEPPCAGVNDIPVELIASATAMSMPAPSVSVWPSRRLLMLAPWMRANFALPVTFMFDGATSMGNLYAPVSSLSVTAMSISRSCRTPRNEGLALAMSVRLPMAVPTPKFSCMGFHLSWKKQRKICAEAAEDARSTLRIRNGRGPLTPLAFRERPSPSRGEGLTALSELYGLGGLLAFSP